MGTAAGDGYLETGKLGVVIEEKRFTERTGAFLLSA
jgi:hypothetical protein